MAELICKLELEDLKKSGSCANNSKGVKVIYYALLSDVSKMPTLPNVRNKFEDFCLLSEGGIALNGVDHSIQMKSGKNFFKFYCGRDLGELKYSVQGATGGKSLNANLEVMHPGLRKEILGFMASTMNEELIILCVLNNGDVHVLGDKMRGAEFGDSAEATSGKAIGDQIGLTINFTYDTPTAQIYIGDVDGLLADFSGSSN
jgi:hypothetical protein